MRGLKLRAGPRAHAHTWRIDKIPTARPWHKRHHSSRCRCVSGAAFDELRSGCAARGVSMLKRSVDTTGSGKTVLISDLVAQIRARGERCVLYDKMGAYSPDGARRGRNPCRPARSAPETAQVAGERSGNGRRPGRLDLTCSRSGRSPRPHRAPPTTSATATTRRTIPSTARPAPGPAGARTRSVSPDRSIPRPSGRCWRARCRTAPGPSSGDGERTGRSSTAPAATSPSRPRSRSRSRRSSAAMRGSSKPTRGRD